MQPDFYGYIPDGMSRTLIFGCMLLNSMLLLLIRSICAALLMQVKSEYFALYLAGDMGAYMLQKILRSDFHYWLPVDGKLGLVVSLTMRVGIKVVTDYTGILQMRGSPELGGVYWTLSLAMAIPISLASIDFCYKHDDEGGVDDGRRVVVEERTVRQVVGFLSAAWLVSFIGVLVLMKKEYWRTFFSFETGREWVQAFFYKGANDAARSSIFECNRKIWKPIEEELKSWVEDNWERWEEEQPKWFSEAWKSRLDDDWLSATELRRQKTAGGGQRRKSSVADVARASGSGRTSGSSDSGGARGGSNGRIVVLGVSSRGATIFPTAATTAPGNE
jgi:hypothetical protein